MKLTYPDYQNCGVNLANSILRHFGAPTHHATLPALDAKLAARPYKNILVLLIDGLGSKILERHLPAESFLRRHHASDLSAVFPATTTAATTSICSGLTPMEHCWLGWNNYVPDIDKVVTMYLNTIKDTETPAADYNVCQKFFAYTDIFQQIRAAGGQAIHVSSYEPGEFYFEKHNLEECIDRIKLACDRPDQKYIYAYFADPDHTMHDYGVDAPETAQKIREIDAAIQDLATELSDTLLIVTADHGHRDIDYKVLSDYPKLYETLLRPTSIEARAANFFIKPDMKDQFEREFAKDFSDKFVLFTKRQVLDRQLFGDGQPHPRFEKCLGDFMTIAGADQAINDTNEAEQLVSTHAGLTADEMTVPFIVAELSDDLTQN
ncbi:MAG: alkaline phosphatase family protein [Candidatus Nomurabacteria bacterium]|jgi:predicted AlkP superfamily pyrophosphatase or phosphodiesterase|nr:alkaline phosphatase family protein [Candidatus Nomurabacteria bacterium]